MLTGAICPSAYSLSITSLSIVYILVPAKLISSPSVDIRILASGESPYTFIPSVIVSPLCKAIVSPSILA